MRHLKRKILGLLAVSRMVTPLAWCCYRDTVKIAEGNTGNPDPKPITLLALNAERFRKDLELLVKTGKYRIYKAPDRWQGRFIRLFYPDNAKVFETGKTVAEQKAQKAIQKFLFYFLKSYYRLLKIDAVLSAAIHYSQDYDWGIVSHRLGYPYIVLHRENLYASRGHINFIINKLQKFVPFEGAHVIVHNDIVRDTWIKSGYITPDKISALGCMRMDHFIQSLKTSMKKNSQEKRKCACFFSFVPGTGLVIDNQITAWGNKGHAGHLELFQLTHKAFIEIAQENPSIDFIIKPKWGGRWKENITEMVKKSGINISGLKNLIIDETLDAHKIILERADVVTGFGSTTLLEAALAGKTVIVPHFSTAAKEAYQDFILLKEDYPIFEVASSVEEFKKLILQGLYNTHIPGKDLQKERGRVFEKYISPLACNAIENYSKKIHVTVQERSVWQEHV